MALMLEVREGETFSLDDGKIAVTVSRVGATKVRLSIQAPDEIDIGRPYGRIKPPDMPTGLKPPKPLRHVI
jgi:sRNA-binding carbon storage regulator CsrA